MKVRFFFILMLFTFHSFSQSTFESDVVSGLWTSSSSWNETVAGGDADGVPDSDDIVIIKSGHTITGSSSGYTRAVTLTVNSGGTLNLNPVAANQLLINNFTNNGSVLGPGTIRPLGTHSINGLGTFSDVDLSYNGSLLTINGNFEFRNINIYSGADLEIASSKTLSFTGQIKSNSSLSVITNNGTINISNGNFMTGSYSSTSNLLSSNGNIVYSHSSNIPIPSDSYNNLTISSTATLNSDLNLNGNLINNGTLTSSGSSTITFNGSSTQSISGSGTSNLENIILDNSSGLNLSSGNINVSGILESSSGGFTQDGANITLKSTASNLAGMIKVSSSSGYSYSSGVFTTERYFNATSSGWRMVGAPIQNSTLNDWDDEFDYCGFTGSDYSYSGCGNFCSVWFYDETSAQVGNSGAGFDSATNITNSTTPDNGSIIYTGQGATTLSVTGSPEFRDRSFSVTKSGADAAFGYNLISNPYPCSLDWATFRGDNTFLDNSYYIYQADAGNYLSVSGSGTIPHSQGFFVKKTSTGTSTLNLSTSQTVNTQANFTKSVNGINLPLTLKLTSNVNTYYDLAHINTGSNYSNNYDPGEDIFELFSPYPDYVPNLFFLDNQGNKLDRTSINNNNSVDLIFDTKIGQFAHGTYTINFENLSQFMIGSCLTLEDLHNGIQTDLRLDSSYTFLSDSNAISPRFKLHIDVDYDIIVSNSTCFQDSSANITFQGSSIIGSFFNLIDSMGTLSDSIMATQDSLSFTNLNAGIYNILTNHIGRCNLQVQDIIIVEPQEVIANFQNINDTIFLDSSGSATIDFNNVSNGANYYIWNFGDGSISNLNSPTHSYNSSGIYIVSLEARSDSIGTCSSTYSKSINVINPFSTVDNNFEISKDFTFSISDKYIELNFENKFEYEVELQIFSIDNKLVYSRDDLNSLNKINLSNLNSGIYIITLLNQYSFETLYLKKFFLN